MSHRKPFDPDTVKPGDVVLAPDGDIITVAGVLRTNTETYDATLCKTAPDGAVPHKKARAAARSGDVVIWGD